MTLVVMLQYFGYFGSKATSRHRIGEVGALYTFHGLLDRGGIQEIAFENLGTLLLTGTFASG
jgi:hypothetical protein